MSDQAVPAWGSVESKGEVRSLGLPLRIREVHLGDRVFLWSLRGLAWSSIALLAVMIGLLTWMSWGAITHLGWNFFVSAEWNTYREDYGLLAMVYGTLVSSLIALALAVPTSLGVAIFLNELAPTWLARPLAFFVEMLAAIPSIVYGLWGLFVLAPFLRAYVQPFLGEWFGFLPLFSGPPLGIGMMCAGCILAIMITPTISSIAREVFRTIPATHREAALGLGATRWEMLRIAVFGSSVSGMIAASVLGLGRALGETMAVTMVIGNSPEINASLFGSGQTMASLIANQYAEASGALHLSALTYIGLCLFLVSLCMNGLARWIIWRIEKRLSGAR